MILFDTNVIIDARDGNSIWREWAERQVALALSSGGAVVNPIIVAEVCVKAKAPQTVATELERMGITIVDLPASTAARVGAAYAVYVQRRKAEGQVAPKVPLPDFFIGAHAEMAGFRLVTRDPNRIKTYYPAVSLIVP